MKSTAFIQNPYSSTQTLAITDIKRKVERESLVLTHPLQRRSKQWSIEQKSNLIRCILEIGNMPSLLVCSQTDDNGIQTSYLIDGVQRVTTICEFIHDTFALSKNTRYPKISYNGILYQTKQTKNGKFVLKRDRNKCLIPIVDIEGKQQKVNQEIDIRGLRWSDLPPELQERILYYQIHIQYQCNCTDEDIQKMIIDYNSGTAMNVAQIGKSTLGVTFAQHVSKLAMHPFIREKCGFTYKNEIAAVVERSIAESLALVNFGTDGWMSEYKALCRRLANWMDEECIDRLREMFDILEEVVPEDKEIKAYLVNKEFFITMANFAHFLDTDYAYECYGKFLYAFVHDLMKRKNIPTGEVDDFGNEIEKNYMEVYMTSGKQPKFVESRLEKLNEIMDEWLAENCAGELREDEECDDTVSEIGDNTAVAGEAVSSTDHYDTENNDYRDDSSKTKATQEMLAYIKYMQRFDKLNLCPADKDVGVKTLMQFTGYPMRQFEEISASKFLEWMWAEKSNADMEDCLFYAEILADDIKKADAQGKFSGADIAILVRLLRDLQDDVDDNQFITWMRSYQNTEGQAEAVTSGEIVNRENELKNNIFKFIQTLGGLENESIKDQREEEGYSVLFHAAS